MKFLRRCASLVTLLGTLAIPALAQNPSHFTITLDASGAVGVVHFADGSPDQSLTGQNNPPHASYFLASQYFYHPIFSAHEEITVRYRVRYTASNPADTLPTSFSGLVGNHSVASANAYSTGIVTVSSHPDNNTGASVSAFSSPDGYGYPQSQDIQKYTLKTVNLSSKDGSGNPLTDSNGNHYAEGTVDLKAILDMVGENGTKTAGAEISFGQPKTILIVRPENSASPASEDNEALGGFIEPDQYTSDGITGAGHTRFSNDVYLGTIPPTLIAGKDFRDEVWNLLFLGYPWPSFNDIITANCRRDWSWFSNDGNSDSGSNMSGFPLSASIPPFITARPHVDWPWVSGGYKANYIPLDFLDEVQSNQAPPVVTQMMSLELTDTDQSGQHPEWNFGKMATFDIKFHNRYEEATNLVTSPTPLKDNPWHLYRAPTTFSSQLGDIMQSIGLAPSQDTSGNDMPGTGTYPWSPGSVTAYLENSISVSINCEYAGAGTDINSGRSVTQNVPSKNVPINFVGTVYYLTIKNRTTFNYKHHLKGGRHVLGFNSDGTEILHKGQIDRPTGGISFVAWVQKAGSTWPASTDLDLASM